MAVQDDSFALPLPEADTEAAEGWEPAAAEVCEAGELEPETAGEAAEAQPEQVVEAAPEPAEVDQAADPEPGEVVEAAEPQAAEVCEPAAADAVQPKQEEGDVDPALWADFLAKEEQGEQDDSAAGQHICMLHVRNARGLLQATTE